MYSPFLFFVPRYIAAAGLESIRFPAIDPRRAAPYVRIDLLLDSYMFKSFGSSYVDFMLF